MQISKRLKAVADMVTPGCRVADVGCDHAYTAIYLVANRISPSVIAMDVKQGPIDRAKENISRYGYDRQIDVRRSDGLEKLHREEADTILIAGMGGALMIRILFDRMDIVNEVRELVLQPQAEIHKVRRMLTEIGFLITDENMLKEDGKYYVCMKAKRRALIQHPEQYELHGDTHFHYGRLLLEQNHPVLKKFLEKEKGQYEGILARLNNESADGAVTRRNELQEELFMIQEALHYYNA